MKPPRFLTTLASTALCIATVSAQNNNDRFKIWDKNSDGKLTENELPEKARERFPQIDADKDGVLTPDEMDAYVQRRNAGLAAANEPKEHLVPKSISPVEELKIDDSAYAVYRKPPGDGPFPAVIFLHGGLGQTNIEKLRQNSLNQLTSARFLAWGYVTVNATRRAIMHDPQDQGVIDDTVKIIDAVKALPEVDPQSIVLYGGSGGGTLALELARKTDLAAVVAGEPASIIFMGMFTKDHIVTGKDGKPAGDRRWDVMNADPKTLYTPELRKHTRQKLAEIECPVLVLHGDQHALKKFNFDILVPEMKELGKSIDLIIYPGENHGFYWGRGKEASLPLKANRDADAFFRKHIATPPQPIDADSHNAESPRQPAEK